jgi:dihydroorotate dehydrogenase subfamily 2
MANSVIINTAGFVYQHALKPVFFWHDPEKVHVDMVKFGQRLGDSTLAKKILSSTFRVDNQILRHSLFGIDFSNPIGLSAGFDYEARLTRVLPAIGFGFGTVGTLTHEPYAGNRHPMLGRLPKSRSLMVNKGFKNDGVRATLERHADKKFRYPVGVSIGKTNIVHSSQKEAIEDIVAGFRDAEESRAPFAYYELNISCPNLKGGIEFYSPSHLRELLKELVKLHIKRPVFLKMPISESNDAILDMIKVAIDSGVIQAVIIGNLQRDRKDLALVQSEVAKFSVGNFSGKPCQRRSDELIAVVYRQYGGEIKIIGSGGIFSAHDAYRKIRLGASLAQLITGMIYQGPQLIAQINQGLVRMLRRDGLSSIGDAIGLDS